MEVIYFQAFIVITIITTRFLKPEWLFGACVAWTIETAIMIFHPPLMAIQLTVIWGLYLLLKKKQVTDKDKEASFEQLNEFLSSFSERQNLDQLVEHTPSEKTRIIQDKEHRQVLINTIKNSNKCLLITSGWINKYAVDKKVISHLNAAISRGVSIYIGFGYQNKDRTHKPQTGSNLAVNSLKTIAKKSPEKMSIGFFGNHQKLLIKDKTTAIIGSYNWLSNRDAKNHELSVSIANPELSERLFNEVMIRIHDNPIKSGDLHSKKWPWSRNK